MAGGLPRPTRHSNVLVQLKTDTLGCCKCCTRILSVCMTLNVQEEFREAVDILLLAEESFRCCKDDLLEYIDNLGLLLMDTVW